ncbi:pilus assembly protein [Paenibacillus phoenicis]|uniref:Pilus assembly protein n=1 Tax=Paenibacillus phoenicis TaxID=554117 RepID=A0ABU5PFU5_9BACL|nr:MULTISPECIES: pilus assembly protein [Paenibacillus]MCT2193816.1 pilus assembly protein [Paenibacillus sp. p3-SID1389]MEA3568637.1 pilus assembly protein [Paenibacillus phoenicis]
MKLWQDQRGVFTVEASLVLPLIFYTVLILLFFCLYLYQQALLGQAAIVAAERTAYTWDNSYRDGLTGAYADGKYDSLYWRLGDDGLLQAIFGGDGGDRAVKLALPADAGDGEAQSLPLKKLNRTGARLPEGIDGEMRYDNRLLLRKVSVALDRFVPLAPLEAWIDDIHQRSRAESYVVEPTEWIRTVELARYYGEKFRSGKGAGGMDKQEAQEALIRFGK